MADINIVDISETAEGYDCHVKVGDFSYHVSLMKDYYVKLTGGEVTPEKLIVKSFEFLLEREGPESILPKFDLPKIQHYFPDYETTIQQRV